MLRRFPIVLALLLLATRASRGPRGRGRRAAPAAQRPHGRAARAAGGDPRHRRTGNNCSGGAWRGCRRGRGRRGRPLHAAPAGAGGRRPARDPRVLGRRRSRRADARRRAGRRRVRGLRAVQHEHARGVAPPVEEPLRRAGRAAAAADVRREGEQPHAAGDLHPRRGLDRRLARRRRRRDPVLHRGGRPLRPGLGRADRRAGGDRPERLRRHADRRVDARGPGRRLPPAGGPPCLREGHARRALPGGDRPADRHADRRRHLVPGRERRQQARLLPPSVSGAHRAVAGRVGRATPRICPSPSSSSPASAR